MRTVTAEQGQAWDDLAFEVYGDEQQMSLLLRENPDLATKQSFTGGESVNAPRLEDGAAGSESAEGSSTVPPPPWEQ